MFTVVLDACTLVPITLCDTLLRIAETGSFGVRWSATSPTPFTPWSNRRRAPRAPSIPSLAH